MHVLGVLQLGQLGRITDCFFLRCKLACASVGEQPPACFLHTSDRFLQHCKLLCGGEQPPGMFYAAAMAFSITASLCPEGNNPPACSTQQRLLLPTLQASVVQKTRACFTYLSYTHASDTCILKLASSLCFPWKGPLLFQAGSFIESTA